MDLLGHLGTITMYGYLFGRELLGTIERVPTYLTNDSDFREKALMINEGTTSWEFETVWDALDEANHDLLRRFLAIPTEEEAHLSERTLLGQHS